MTDRTPRNINEARLQANVTARAARLFEDGYEAVQKDEWTFDVYSDEGAKYEVSTLWEDCSCPCFKNHRFCKHERGLTELLKKQEARDAAQCAEFEAQYYHALRMEEARIEASLR